MKARTQCIFFGLVWLLLVTLNSPLSTVFAQGATAFTYQGQLRDNGTNGNGTYTMIFKLYDAASAGNQIGGMITTSPALANGLFTVSLDFGAGAFNGGARWLDITVTNGPDTQTLSPRVQVLPVPYAQFAAAAASVTNGAIKNAQLAPSAVSSNNIASGQVVKTLNGLTDTVALLAGTNVTLTTNGNALQISTSGGGTAPNSFAAGNNVGLLTNGGVVQISALFPNIQVFTNNGTFNVPSNVTRIMVEMWGGGGGGGAAIIDSGGVLYGGGSGGGGGYSRGVFQVTAGSNYLVSVGLGGKGSTATNSGGFAENGGNSAFGGLILAGGGGGGPDGNGNESIDPNGGSGGIGSSISSTILNISGGDGDSGGYELGRGNGGFSPQGGAGGITDHNAGNGGSGKNPGGGGGSAGFNSTQQHVGVSGSGGNGLVIIYY